MKIGVLAVQGGFAAHAKHLASVGAQAVEVRTPQEFDDLEGLILPGGESTTIMMGIEAAGLAGPIAEFHAAGKPILGTCAGMIVADRDHLGLIEITTKRNAFGRQLASFEEDIEIDQIADGPVRAVFIRAPWVEWSGDGVKVLATVRDHPVAVTEGTVAAVSFHPELTDDDRIHRWFKNFCSAGRYRRAGQGDEPDHQGEEGDHD